MKLFITNKKYFEENFTSTDEFYLNSQQIHVLAFNELKLSIEAHNSIPLMLTPDYKTDGSACFQFTSIKGDIYFYEYIGTAS